MRIGLDIDGCLNDSRNTLLNKGIKWLLNNGYQDIKFNNKLWDFDQVFALNENDKLRFMKDTFKDILMSTKVREDASEVINKLHNEGHQIIIITGRKAYDEYFGTDGNLELGTTKWLMDNNIFYDQIIFDAQDKEDICVKNNIDIMIEDWGPNAEAVSKKLPVLLFETNYNFKYIGENIIPVYSWYDIYIKVLNMSNKGD